jgi:hypothetical protein
MLTMQKVGITSPTSSGHSFNLDLVHPVTPVFNENHKSIAFVRKGN